MPEIRVLEKQIAELIAAGEVIDRPASVIKELVENCIDAGAGVVTVEIKNGGITYMRVTDNGCGIHRSDVPKAFLRHATSKVRGKEDLEAIGSLGFRGEALASIAAMCKVELLTRAEGEETGVRYRIEGGSAVECTEAGCPRGTTIVVRDIFFNTPARMKFLKKDATEAAAVAAVVEKAALSHPEISFKFIRDGELKLQTPGNSDLHAAVYAVMGRAFSATLTPVNSSYEGLTVTGFVSKPTDCRPNRTMQNFFINGRYVRSRTCMAALEEAYKHASMVGKFPACVLALTIPAGAVDVNVHPTKLEVRFVQEKAIFDLVYYGVRSALAALDAQGEIREIPTPKAPKQENVFAAVQHMSAAEYRKQSEVGMLRQKEADVRRELRDTNGDPFDAVFTRPRPAPAAQPAPAAAKQAQVKTAPSVPAVPTVPPHRMEAPKQEGAPRRLQPLPPVSEPVAPKAAVQPQQITFAAAEPKLAVEESGQTSVLPKAGRFADAALVGELFETYILLQTAERMILIDKHAAHERLLFEKLKEENREVDRQTLLTPLVITLSRPEHQAMLESLELLEQLGILAEDFGGSQVVVREIPVMLDRAQAQAAVAEIAGKLLEQRHDLTPQAFDELLHSIACRSAIKAHDYSSPQELAALVRLLEEHEDVRFCPHGRPIASVITKTQIEKMFGRV